MNTTQIDGILFAKMIEAGAANLSANRKIVNDLNVFPIPDGDTGDNMFMTINSGASMIKTNENRSLSKTASLAARGMLLGARGNSGVILSRIFSGISRGLGDCQSADIYDMHKALEAGVDESYSAVSVPVEGTILTVYKDAVSFAGSNITDGESFERYFEDLTCELRRSLDRTPDLLDVLREAGVVDSGGAGFVYIAEGMRRALSGEEIMAADAAAPAQKTVDITKFNEDSELEFGYCTEFLLQLQRSKVDADNFDITPLADYLNDVGNSLVIFKEGTIVKVHVHTMKPGDILNHCQQFGEFLTLKIENMMLQHNETTIQNNYEPITCNPHKKYGIVTVAAGDGIKETFVSLGCDAVVDGGQSMNPSAQDLINAFEKVNADVIFVFPNNSNIVLTAKQAASLYDKADVRIIPTKTIGEGYAAISMFDQSVGEADDIVENLKEIIEGVVTGAVSVAVRDTEKDGVTVRKDEYIGFVDDTIHVSEKDRNAALLALTEKLGAKDYDIMLLIVGSDATDEEAQAAYAKLKESYRRTEIIMINGGQPIYDYIIILE